MKYVSLGFESYIIDDDMAKRLKQSQLDEKAERQRDMDRITLKRGMWWVYASIFLFLLNLVIFFACILFERSNLLSIFVSFVNFIVWGWWAAYNNGNYKKAKARAV